jgi:phage-related protein
MAFYGCEFIFDDLPCTEFGLMVYNFGSNTQSDVSFQSTGDVSEDRIAGRYDSLMYGLVQNKSLEYTLVFGANLDSMDANESIDRFEAEEIATWLTGHQTRKWLAIVQPDMEPFRYLCLISDLRLITYGDMPWAFSCRVSCDSPFAYTFPEEYTYKVAGQQTAVLHNRSSYRGFYMPKLELSTFGANRFSITNASDNNRAFTFDRLPSGESLIIRVDNKNQVITNNHSFNLYDNFNHNFFRMVRGDNRLVFNGHGTVKFTCEFPINVGG